MKPRTTLRNQRMKNKRSTNPKDGPSCPLHFRRQPRREIDHSKAYAAAVCGCVGGVPVGRGLAAVITAAARCTLRSEGAPLVAGVTGVVALHLTQKALSAEGSSR